MPCNMSRVDTVLDAADQQMHADRSIGLHQVKMVCSHTLTMPHDLHMEIMMMMFRNTLTVVPIASEILNIWVNCSNIKITNMVHSLFASDFKNALNNRDVTNLLYTNCFEMNTYLWNIIFKFELWKLNFLMFVIGTLKPNDIFELLPGMLFCDRVMRSHVPYSFGSLFYFKDSRLLFRFYVSVKVMVLSGVWSSLPRRRAIWVFY